ncbi:hypothetical protein [Kordia sp.]|uniref:hypothetical protein n=1 Tax=Kordia sp. TaxID=1965332 RepID=UPI003B5B3B3D
MKNLFVIFSFLLVITSCKHHKVISAEKESLIINNCLSYIKEKSKENCYLVYPKYYSFDISKYSDLDNKYLEEFFKLNNEEQIQKIESDTDEIYLSKFSKELENLSSCEESNNIIGFSGISNEIVIAHRSYYYNKISNKKLQNSSDELQLMEYEYFIFFIDTNGNIKQVVNEGSIIFG